MSDEKQNETEQIIAEAPAEPKKSSRAPRKTAPATKKSAKKTDESATSPTPKAEKKIRKVTRDNLIHLTTFERLVRESIGLVAGRKNNIRIERSVIKTISDMCVDKLIKLLSLSKNASAYKGVESIDSGAILVTLKTLMAVKKAPSLAF